MQNGERDRREPTSTAIGYTTSYTVTQSPEEVYAAVLDVPA
ncbi:hypothetical protein [Nocardioides sp. SYSU DS0651]